MVLYWHTSKRKINAEYRFYRFRCNGFSNGSYVAKAGHKVFGFDIKKKIDDDSEIINVEKLNLYQIKM